MLGRLCGVLIPALVLTAATAATVSAADDQKILSGVFTPDQVASGKAVYEATCATCHRSDLSGDRGPALKGDHFFENWESGTVGALYQKIKETMPKNRASTLTEDNNIELVAYILQSNGFPASTKDVLLETDVLEDILILRKGVARKGVPNFSLVEVVGCLTQGQDKSWKLTNTTTPVMTKDQPLSAQEMKESAAKPLGAETFLLLSVNHFKPEDYKGKKMQAKGLLYRAPNDARLSLTSFQAVDSTCSTTN